MKDGTAASERNLSTLHNFLPKSANFTIFAGGSTLTMSNAGKRFPVKPGMTNKNYGSDASTSSNRKVRDSAAILEQIVKLYFDMKIIALEEHTVDRAIGAATAEICKNNVPYLNAFYRADMPATPTGAN